MMFLHLHFLYSREGEIQAWAQVLVVRWGWIPAGFCRRNAILAILAILVIPSQLFLSVGWRARR